MEYSLTIAIAELVDATIKAFIAIVSVASIATFFVVLFLLFKDNA